MKKEVTENKSYNEKLYEDFKRLYIKYGVDLTELNLDSPDKVYSSLKWYLYNMDKKKSRHYSKEDYEYILENIACYI